MAMGAAWWLLEEEQLGAAGQEMAPEGGGDDM